MSAEQSRPAADPSQPAPVTTGSDDPVVPKSLRTWAYVSGTAVLVFATSVGDAIPEPWGRLLTGYGAAALALAVGYRPTR